MVLRRWLAILVAGVGASACATGPAEAGVTTKAAGSSSFVGAPLIGQEPGGQPRLLTADAAGVLDYWTTALMDAASPLTDDVAAARSGGSTAAPAAGSSGTAGSSSSNDAGSAPVDPGNGNLHPVTKAGTTCHGPRTHRVCVTRNTHGKRIKQCISSRARRICTTYAAHNGKKVRICIRTAGRTRCRKPRALAAEVDIGFVQQPIPAVGKIYFLAPQYNYQQSSCTGTLLDPSTVLTAAHCVYNKATGAETANPMFAPGQAGTLQTDGSYLPFFQAFGRYAVDRRIYWAAYQTRADGLEDVALDYAFLHLSTPVTGVTTYAAQWSFVPDVGATLWKYGYPAEGYWRSNAGGDAQFQVYCQTTLDGWEQPLTDNFVMKAQCRMNGGSSGGPTFAKVEDGTWKVVSVASRCPRDATTQYCGVNSSPYFDTDFGALWNRYEQGQGGAPPTVGITRPGQP